jgi:Ca2+-binding RTX toxin-like protein
VGGTKELFGEEGNDTLDGDASQDAMDGASGDVTLVGGEDIDLHFGGSVANSLSSSEDDDLLYDNKNRNLLVGGQVMMPCMSDRANALFGRKGTDTLSGSIRRDSIFGNPGDDLIIGEEPADRFSLSATAANLEWRISPRSIATLPSPRPTRMAPAL